MNQSSPDSRDFVRQVVHRTGFFALLRRGQMSRENATLHYEEVGQP